MAATSLYPSLPGAAAGAEEPSSHVELHVSCNDLPSCDTFSKSDPMVVVSLQGVQGTWHELGRTEALENVHNPNFTTSFRLDYMFESTQRLRFDVYDVDDANTRRLDLQDYIGRVEVNLSAVVTARGQSHTSPIVHERGASGTLTVHAEEVEEDHLSVRLKFHGRKLDKKDLFGKSDPYFEIFTSRENSWVSVYRSHVIKKTLNPEWEVCELPMSTLCGGDRQRPLLFRVWDHNKRGSPDFIGECQTNLAALESGDAGLLELVNPQKKKKKKKYRHSGVLHLVHFEVVHHPSFLDYITGGVELSLVVAIDYTASNGNPQTPTSLHYYTPYQPNAYTLAIEAVGSILSAYDTDNIYPVFGFGAKLPPAGTVSHCFAVNGQSDNPNVRGIEGVLSAYQMSLAHLRLYGPTLFSPLIRRTADIIHAAEQTAHAENAIPPYTVLLIITDGEITDIEDTIDTLVEVSHLPLSIVIVGVGDADFDSMDRLDGDDALLRSRTGETAERDIVQFVPFNAHSADPAALARETLHEIPGQFVSYMQKHKIPPPPPLEVDPNALPTYTAATTTTAAPPPTY